MIYIITEEIDKTTDEIIEWIINYKYKFVRKNVEQFSDFTLKIGNNVQSQCQFNNTYHRRGRLNILPVDSLKTEFRDYLLKEENPILKAYEKIQKEKYNYVGEYSDEEQHNKILDLHIAKKVGLKIPDSIITNNKKELSIFFKAKEKIITKCIKYPLNIETNNFFILGKNTFIIKAKDIERLADNFAISLFQEYIEKKYEIRVFFYKMNLFSMAIFSQNDEKTKLDYRNYNDEKPNRNVPFLLPIEIKKKLIRFCKLKKINTGSIDLIYTPNNEFYFLENNPQGQFHWLSNNCNYNIEKLIAQDLIKNEKK